jgi:hypothetical protein
MRWLTLVPLLLIGAAPGLAQKPVQPAAAPAGNSAEVEALRQRLLASQQTIATLERELEDAKNRTVALERCRTKNGHLVSIGRQLIQGYEQRYRQDRHRDPLQLARRRFEFELQALTEVIYDNNVDVPIHVPDPNPVKSDAPAGDSASTPASAPATSGPENSQ